MTPSQIDELLSKWKYALENVWALKVPREDAEALVSALEAKTKEAEGYRKALDLIELNAMQSSEIGEKIMWLAKKTLQDGGEGK